MIGMAQHTGRKVEGDAHLVQSIGDILSTPIGSRVMRRDYGSDLPNIIDQPLNGETLIDVYLATAEALHLWEPRIKVERVQITKASPGAAEIELTFDGETQPVTIEVAA